MYFLTTYDCSLSPMQSAVPVMTNTCILLCQTCFSIKAITSDGRISPDPMWLSLCHLLQIVLTRHLQAALCIGNASDWKCWLSCWLSSSIHSSFLLAGNERATTKCYFVPVSAASVGAASVASHVSVVPVVPPLLRSPVQGGQGLTAALASMPRSSSPARARLHVCAGEVWCHATPLPVLH